MRFKRFIYSLLLILFILILVADLGLWFLVPSGSSASVSESVSLPEGVTMPDGMDLPEGMSLPEGMTFPDGGSFPSGGSGSEGGFSFGSGFPGSGSSSESGGFPEGMSFPEGMTFPGAGEESEDGSRRPGRSGSKNETETAESAETVETAEWTVPLPEAVTAYLPMTELTAAKEAVRPYRLYILIGAALGMVLCIVRLAFLNRKLRKQREEKEADTVLLKRVALWPAFLLLLGALVLVVLLFPVDEEEESEDGAVADVKVLTGTVEEKTLTSLIQSAGSLEEQEAVTLEIPTSVTVASVCVRNGDTVTAGQIIGKVDQTSVMQAIAAIHEAMDGIDGQLQTAHDARTDFYIYVPVEGTVKVVYAQVGETVMDVMNEHGALMVLSLDGCMAVQVPAAGDLSLESQVVVTLSDGTELEGQVAFLEEGVATVTVVDRGYAIGEQVSVKNADGTLLGSGALYVHRSLNITGYLGTITRVYRSEGGSVYAGAPVIALTDTADLAEYLVLLQQRSEYEEELKTLFEIYEDGYLHAPCDGVITGLSDDLTYASLTAVVNGTTARHMSSRPDEADPAAYVHYLGRVKSIDGSAVELEQVGEADVSSFSPLPDPSGYMTGTYTIQTGNIYLFSGGWNLVPVSEIKVGDKLLFTFDQNGALVWVIVEHTESAASGDEGTGDDQGQGGQGQSGGHTGGQGSGGVPSGGSGGFSGGSGVRIPSGSTGGSGSAQSKTYTVARQTFCSVTPQEKMLITVPVDELDVLSLSLGQEADLYLDALPATGFTATVTEIDPEGENSGGNTKYSVTLALDRQAQLYPGMNGVVCFPRSEEQAVATVPLAALTEDGGRTMVYTAYDEETDELLSPVEVQTGVSDGTDVQILSGLTVGDTYCYKYADSISYVTE